VGCSPLVKKKYYIAGTQTELQWEDINKEYVMAWIKQYNKKSKNVATLIHQFL
jgi:hypothetical protein